MELQIEIVTIKILISFGIGFLIGLLAGRRTKEEEK
jgi:hypothetical protein